MLPNHAKKPPAIKVLASALNQQSLNSCTMHAFVVHFTNALKLRLIVVTAKP